MTEHVPMYTPSLTLIIIMPKPWDSIYIPDNGVTFITLFTNEAFCISDNFISFTLLGGHCL